MSLNVIFELVFVFFYLFLAMFFHPGHKKTISVSVSDVKLAPFDATDTYIVYMTFLYSIITQVIIEILVLSFTENGVIFRYNHLRRGDYSGI